MTNNNEIRYSRIVLWLPSSKYHIVKKEYNASTVLCGLPMPTIIEPRYYTPMRADICKSCYRIHYVVSAYRAREKERNK